jgi:hypothetical protein
LRLEKENTGKNYTATKIKDINFCYVVKEVDFSEIVEIYSEKINIKISDRSNQGMQELGKYLAEKKKIVNETTLL